MSFDPELAMLRHVRMGSTEVVRAIFAAIRDRDWNTIPFVVHELKIEQFSDQFQLSFDATCSDVPFQWHSRIGGTADGTVRYEFQGEATGTFLKNRIGLCVLHPITPCAGQPCRIEHTDGTVEDSVFPLLISPDQPQTQVRSIQHTVHSGLDAIIELEGEAFEMEDQRNWTDASYKTYSTPLDLPFPVEVQQGWTVHHSANLRLEGAAPPPPEIPPVAAAEHIRFDWQQPHRRVSVGLAMAPDDRSPPDAVRSTLNQLRCDHLRVDVDLRQQEWMSNLRHALELIREIDGRLEIAVHTENTTSESWQTLLGIVGPSMDRLARWLIFDATKKVTSSDLAAAAAESLNQFNGAVDVAFGTDAYFAELNRDRPNLPGDSKVCYSINPQVHAFDNLSICETLEAQTATVESANTVFGKPVVISPITLLPRFNPNATSISSDDQPSMPAADHRQPTGFLAAWTAAMLGRLATDSRVSSLTLYETHGPRGIMTTDGVPYPVYSTLDAYLQCEAVCRAHSTSPLSVAGVGLLHRDGSREALVANMSDVERSVMIDDDMAPITIGPESMVVVAMEKR